MPKIENIPAGAYDPEEISDVSEESLQAELEEAQERLAEVRGLRGQIRAETPAPKVLEALAETDEDFQAAIDAVNQAEKRLGRFLGGRGPGRRIPVGVARSGDGAEEVSNNG